MINKIKEEQASIPSATISSLLLDGFADFCHTGSSKTNIQLHNNKMQVRISFDRLKHQIRAILMKNSNRYIRNKEIVF